MATVRTRLATRLVRLIGIKRRLRRLAELEGDKEAFERQLARLRWTDRTSPPLGVRVKWNHEVVDVDGHDLHLMRAKKAATGRGVILYLHGGGYLFGPFGTEWSAMSTIAGQAGCDFAIFRYPRAPEHDVTETVPVTVEAYRRLARRYGTHGVQLIGTSAGGGLAIALVAALRDDGEHVTVGPILLSPGVDMTLRTDVSAREPSDALLTVAHVRSAGRLYAGALSPEHPTVSPLYGDLSALPEMHVFVASDEILLPCIEEFAERAAAAGSHVDVVVGDGQQHTWPAAPTPEGAIARRHIAALVKAALD